ncbi:putative myosin heavy chain [Trypanosoma cruzi]|uniref:Putative myosin heavy chain n=1 Tax=Trypanosoma cruzi TaxID=5693 RepID=A0A2V2XFY9_TRYCR|nr:putative myosin heavy chain [Trypanosoma cruzi]
MRNGGRAGSVTYISSSSDDDDTKNRDCRDSVVCGGESQETRQLTSQRGEVGAGEPPQSTNKPRTSVISGDTKNTSSSLASKESATVQLQTPFMRTELGPGTQVLFLPGPVLPSEAASATAWELGRVVEFSPTATTGKRAGEKTKEISDGVVIVERVGRGGALDGSRIQVDLKCVRRYSYEGSPLDLNDFSTLTEPSDAVLLYALQQRYFGGLHYTFTGRVLLALNPYQRTVYPPHAPHPKDIVESVKEAFCAVKSCSTKGESEGNEFGLESDVDAVEPPCPVALVVTGDSGAGKTETAKFVLHHLLGQMAFDKESDFSSSHEVTASQRTICGRMLHVLDAANCLLESFGNALTPLNGNSSRFAKCVTTYLNPRTGEGVGAKVECYLLEVSRLVARVPGESNFHIFSMLFDGRYGLTPEERNRFDTWDPILFRAMHSGSNELCLSFSPYTLFQFRVALRSVGFSDDKVAMVLQVLCGILYLLNIEFTARDMFAPASVSPASMSALEKASNLLGFSFTDDHRSLETLLTTVRLGTDLRELHCGAAEVARDSTAKHLYESLFQYILRRINEALLPSNTAMETVCAEFTILDIFGFEFKDEKCGNNDLEQLLINYTNETLQRLYEETTFDILLAEAAQEGVNIEWPSEWNQERVPTLELLVQRPRGVLNIINDDSVLAQRSRQEGGANLAALLTSLQKSFPGLIRPHRSSPSKVSLQHFCATVVYDTSNMSSKNRISTAAESTCAASSNEFVQEICGAFLASSTAEGYMPLVGNNTKGATPRSHATTIIAQFRSQIELLMTRLKASNIFWIRCIKPNRNKSPHEFDSELVFSQLKYGAILRSVMLFGQGYCHSLKYKLLVKKYLFLAVRGYCCDAFQHGIFRKHLDFSGSRGEEGKPPLRRPYSDKQTRLKHGTAFNAAVYSARFREACVLATEFVPCCMDGALLLGSSKVFLRSSTLRALLALGKLAKEEASQWIGRVGRGFMERRSLAVARLQYMNEKRLAGIRERIAAELPQREALEREREALLARASEGRAEHLAFLSRQAMRSSKRVERSWKETMNLLTSELTKAIGEMTAFDKARMEKEKEVREEAAMRESCRRRIKYNMSREKLRREVKHHHLIETQREKTRKDEVTRRSRADIDAEREKVIREEIVKARQLQLRVEQEVLVEQRRRALLSRERQEARQVRLHLGKQQRRIADRVRLKEEVRQRRLASQLYLPSRSFPSPEISSLVFGGVEKTATDVTVDDFAALGLVKTPLSGGTRIKLYASQSLPTQRELNSSTTVDDRDPELEWIVQKDMMTLWESLQDGLNT